ncbi:hypothetical protein MACJ_002013 [Theileria orientalis]|uniref:SAC3/GANP/THP3 conserved domain-containing protein n=1 Tax=Theileria orientalis TaxID=68886 RepID=A0A976M5C8_THEOR|nr:hypothetical protein MACJ_002013 [Theileria orientalis]
MYNFRPYGQPGQPVRPSYNMLFSHFKQLGYSDELAGAEANRIMLQTNAYNQMATQPSQNVQYAQNPYQNVNYNTPQNYQFNTAYGQQQPFHNVPNQMAVQHQTQVLQTNAQPNVQHTNYDKNNLLSGVKISSRPSNISPFAPANQASNQSQSNPIQIKLNQQDVKPASMGFHDNMARNVAQTNYVTQNTVNANYQASQPQHNFGYQTNQATTFNYNQPAKTQLSNVQFQNSSYNQGSSNNNLSNMFYIDTKGQKFNQSTQHQSNQKLTIDQVNKWIQELYVHLNMTTCSKKLRAAVNVYIQHILEKFRAGNLNHSDLRMLSPDEIINFDPKQEIKQTESLFQSHTEKNKLETDEEESRKGLHTLKGKKKQVKSKKTEEPPVQKPKLDSTPKGLDSRELQRREQRSQRFKTPQTVPVYNFNFTKNKSIVGVSQQLEKTYLRLTSEPNPMMVRPESVLIKSFKHVFDKFMTNKNYVYIQEQFRSIRQDIQVQHIRSPFVVNVYTTNARLALLHNDLDQFNQCQTQLKHLLKCFHEYQTVKIEFELYYMLYLSLQNMTMDSLRYLSENYVTSATDTTGITSERDRFKHSTYFNFANLVRRSIADENFIQYFKLADTKDIDYDFFLNFIYKQAFYCDDGKKDIEPFNDGKSLFYCKLLFKMFESKFRMFSLYTLCRSSLTISTDVLSTIINFKNINECLDFLREHKVVFNENGLIDCKKTLSVIVESPLMRSKKI